MTPSEILTLSSCSQLSGLKLDGVPLSSCDSLGFHEGIQSLSMKGCGIKNIGLISELPKLNTLDISDNDLKSLSGLPNALPSLKYLYLSGNQSLTSINGIGSFPSLVTLNLTCCGNLNSQYLGVLSQCPDIQYLILDGVPLSTLSFVSELNDVKWLSLNGCSLSDISDLATLPDSVISLDLTANNITDLSSLSSTKVMNVDIGYNKITDITALLTIETLTRVTFGIYDKTLPWVPEELNHNRIPEEQLISLGLKLEVYDYESTDNIRSNYR